MPEPYGTPEPDRTAEQFDRLVADQRTHDLGNRIGYAVVVVGTVAAIVTPVLAVVVGLSWRLFRWLSGV